MNTSIAPTITHTRKIGLNFVPSGPAAADSSYQPTDPQIAFHLARFIEDVRGLPTDGIVLRQDWLRAYDFTTDRGAATSG
jgi:type IV secretory pathway TrbF-like protein